MDFSEEKFRDLKDDLKIKKNDLNQLKRNIIQNSYQKNTSKKPVVFVAVTLCTLLLITSPWYSPAMANLATKIVPIEIQPSFTSNNENSDLTTQLAQFIVNEGYEVNSIGILPDSNSIEISLISGEQSIKQMEGILKPEINQYLSENGYDLYTINFIAFNDEISEKKSDTSVLYDKVSEIVKLVFSAYGYSKEADYELTGIQETWFSNILQIDMPDHIKESKEIIADIQTAIEKQNLDIKDIEVKSFNLEHRIQDYRWAYIASDIYDSMSGKSTYQLTGLSYSVKNGHAYVNLKTNWSLRPSDDLINEIKMAINNYLNSPETLEQIKDDPYKIQFLSVDGESFIEIKNTKKTN
ncbi:hypothetical protein [Oceanihabitans sediminis]|uniref:hypothetical protein n=1 Tax=Oceanihabitans sediminis TaxID=1812012 RepID=UPI00299CDD6C|nr:hypothetical protein [Oceanihabitans sediminis]MDX1774919.1 hypothetical protein [Oceanihabitans sediminis]